MIPLSRSSLPLTTTSSPYVGSIRRRRRRSSADAWAVIPAVTMLSCCWACLAAITGSTSTLIVAPYQVSAFVIHNKLSAQQSRRSTLILQSSSASKRTTARFENNEKERPNYQYTRFNQDITRCQNAKEVLQELASNKGALTSIAGGGQLNSVNFSTAMNRIARHLNSMNHHHQQQQQQQQPTDQRYDRASVLADPRFALLISSLAEAMAGATGNQHVQIRFRSRELSNCAWAIAKLKIAPPQTVAPLSLQNANELLVETAAKLRKQVVDVAKAKQQGNAAAADQSVWIPTLSLLCGHLLDAISCRAMQDAIHFQLQERSNLLWAMATAKRADQLVFNHVGNSLVKGTQELLAGQKQQVPTGNNSRGAYVKDDFLRAQEWSNSIWAMATAQVYGAGQVRLICYMAELLESQVGFINNFKPQECSNSAWGAATILSAKIKSGLPTEMEEQKAAMIILRNVARVLIERADDFKTQELSNTIWAFATLGFGISSTAIGENDDPTPTLNDYVVLPTDDAEEDMQLMLLATDAIIESASTRLNRFRSQELNNFAWSLSRLKRGDATHVLEEIGLQICDPKRRVTPQDIGTTLWSLAACDYTKPAIYKGIASRISVDRSVFFKPQELSNSIWSFATAGITPRYLDIYDNVLVPKEDRFTGPLEAIDDPITLAFGIAAKELMRRPQQFKPQEIKDCLWSFSKVGLRHPDLFRSIAEHLVGTADGKGRARGLDEFSPQGLGNLAWSYARHAQLVEETNKRVDLAVTIASNTGKLAVYSTICFDLGGALSQRLFCAIADADLRVHDNLAKLRSQDLSNTAWAFAVLGMSHSRFFEAAREQFVIRAKQFLKGNQNGMTRFQGQEIANLLWSFAALNFAYPELAETLTPYIMHLTAAPKESIDPRRVAPVFKRLELMNIAWSCAVLGRYPPQVMKLLYGGLVGSGKQSDIKFLNDCFGDDGLQDEAIKTLIYVQLGMELESTHRELALPEKFPASWRQKTAGQRGGNAASNELRLNTSKIQRAVSAAFDRIDFEHVQEHVILMNDLLHNQGIPLSSTPLEVLSIDIANVDAQIGIEVDGPAHYITDIDNIPREVGQQVAVNGKLTYEFNMDQDRQRMNGATALKHRLLRGLGWKVISIPFWEWYDLVGDEEAEDSYCRDLLEAVQR